MIDEQKLLEFIERQINLYSGDIDLQAGVRVGLNLVMVEANSGRLTPTSSAEGCVITDQRIQEWADRYDLPEDIGMLRCMVDDARTLENAPAPEVRDV